MGKVMRHTLGASLNIRHNLSSSKGPKPLQLKLLTTYIPDRKSGSAGMPRPISYAVFCLKKKNVRIHVEPVNAGEQTSVTDQEEEHHHKCRLLRILMVANSGLISK